MHDAPALLRHIPGDGADARGRHGRGEDAILGSALRAAGCERVLRTSSEEESTLPGGGLHLVVVEGVFS